MLKIKWISLMMVVLLSSCAHISEQKKLEHLEAQQKIFMKALRWKAYDTAATVVRFRNPARRLAPIQGLEAITVTSYELLTSLPQEADDSVLAYVLFDYVQNNTGRVYQLKHKQIWWYDDTLKRWFLDSDMPNFKLN